MNQLSWTTVQKRVNDLIPQEVNPRKISDKQMSDLKRSLKKFNLVEIPAVDYDGTILAGHQRIKALQLLERGDEMIDIRVPNRKLTEKEAKEYLIGSNKLGGDWDFEALKSFDLDLLTEAGFDSVELAEFWDKDVTTEDEFDEEKELEKAKTTDIVRGDLLVLGKHKLLCADSTDTKAVKWKHAHVLRAFNTQIFIFSSLHNAVKCLFWVVRIKRNFCPAMRFFKKPG